MRLGALLLVVLVAVAAAGCGGGGDENGGDGGGIRVAVVTDIGGLNDRGFNALANDGLQRAKAELEIDGRVFISEQASDYVPNLSTPARQGYDLVIANGFLMGDALATVAGQFPDTSFAIIDFPWEALKGKPMNARGLVFAEQEGGYLAGVAAASVSDTGVVSSIGGQAVPAVVAFLAGYRAGVNATSPDARVLSAYSEDFVDQAKCTEIALSQVQRRSDVVFAAAGGCGLGALQVAKERGVWGIGVDNDQSFLGPHILTSATKKVDEAVFRTIGDVVDGTFEGGSDTLFDVANGGIGYGEVSADVPNREELVATLEDVSRQIADGDVTPPRS
ncbi:MAG TPA: BMP family ABC transporter substrate-binding protein [Gaiellaceae bacterium]